MTIKMVLTTHKNNRKITEALYVKKHFFFATLIASCSAAFVVGRLARIWILKVTLNNILFDYNDENNVIRTIDNEFTVVHSTTMLLPDPVIKNGKVVPRTTYTSKNFDTRSATTHSRWIVNNKEQERFDSFGPTTAGVFSEVPTVAQGIVGEEEHLPSGQHLLFDLKNIDSHFLNSEQRLATAMLKLVDQCGLTLLSYHCHKLHPSGVSCGGVLLESHVSFHTWPSRGVITIDLFTCGSLSLLPTVPVIEKLFAVASRRAKQKPEVVWAYKKRGFSGYTDIAEAADMHYFPVGQMSDFKKEIVSATTKYQKMDVYDVLRPGVQSLELYKKSLLNDGSYEAKNAELFAPDRILFLDGVMQSRRSGDAAYHESLVHPAMFAHKNPKRVAIVGGGEGATLREVLKHNTVEKVVMIDIDEDMVRLSREFLSFSSDCSDIKYSSKSCFDDPRVETYFEDAFQWFLNRFSVEEVNRRTYDEEPFDVIIVDALDPEVQKEFADTLYESGAAIFSQGLRHSGVLVAQVGEANTMDSPTGEFSINKARTKFIESLVALGVKTIRGYEESHSGFFSPWEFVVAFKEHSGIYEWFSNSAEINLKIRKRAMDAVGGGSLFLHFDGATMESFRFPSKGSEVSFCRDHPTSRKCDVGRGVDAQRLELPLTSSENESKNKQSTVPGVGALAKLDIEHNHYVGRNGVPTLAMGFRTAAVILCLTKVLPSFWRDVFDTAIDGNGSLDSFQEAFEVPVVSSLLRFDVCGVNKTNIVSDH